MPNPFNKANQTTEPQKSTWIPITNSALHCEFCYEASPDGSYNEAKQILMWDCVHCGRQNVVRNLNL